MAGNVWEWCSTRWGDTEGETYPYPYESEDGREDLRGGDDVRRVYRSSSWWNEDNLERRARCAYRTGSDPWNRRNYGGLRFTAPRHLQPLGAES
jgi:iron(II)-dependent oxidoreductase